MIFPWLTKRRFGRWLRSLPHEEKMRVMEAACAMFEQTRETDEAWLRQYQAKHGRRVR